jgi:hypothetical protein
MAAPAPVVSVLITTFNRSGLLRRAINSVLMQDFRDYEIVVIDDCSPDDTTEVVASYNDPRIRYIRNESNIGSKLGDRAILRHFIYDLMRGKYWIYLCDDDYWLYPDLLRRQVDAFNSYDNVVSVFGGQLSHFITTPESHLGLAPNEGLTLEGIDQFFDRSTLTPKTPHLYFMRSPEQGPLFSKRFMTTEEFLTEFAAHPAARNIIGGSTLYSRELFIKSGALMAAQGSQWQAGYELRLGPACFGNTVYFDEPSILAEIRPTNASFRRTQVDHYLDSILSVEISFETPLTHPELASKRRFMRQTRDQTIRNLSEIYLVNGLTILREGTLGLCTDENLSQPVRARHVIPVLWRNRISPRWQLLRCCAEVEFKWVTAGNLFRVWPGLADAQRRARRYLSPIKQKVLQFPQQVKAAGWNVLRAIWRSLPQAVRNVIRPM